ncbi:MAG: hypothetical protein DRP35_05370 [Candidatus Zixiibacteriota bacterium]|nr:MAG: hypothetical protein DRP35_05370 [candidate division Zixibacteria bacterium]
MERGLHNNKNFKQCPNCKKWFSVDDFINNNEIQPIGMKLDNNTFALNLYFFNHYNDECKTTFAMRVDDFEEYIDEKIPHKILAKTDECLNHCANLEDLMPCNNECVFAPYRRYLMKLIDNRIKEAIPANIDY